MITRTGFASLRTLNPKPTIIMAVSEDGETESRGHPSTEVVLRPGVRNITSGGCGVASRHRPLPTAAGLAGLAGSK